MAQVYKYQDIWLDKKEIRIQNDIEKELARNF